MGISVEDELYKLKNSNAAELITAIFVSSVGDSYTIKFLGSNLPASAATGFTAPSVGSNLAVLRSRGQYFIVGAFS